MLRLYPIDPSVRELWKHFPLRVPGIAESQCCGADTLLVQSMEGGFVTQNCVECGGYQTLSSREFGLLDLWIACPECERRMQPQMLNKNYGYDCPACKVGIELSALLPRWQDIRGE